MKKPRRLNNIRTRYVPFGKLIVVDSKFIVKYLFTQQYNNHVVHYSRRYEHDKTEQATRPSTCFRPGGINGKSAKVFCLRDFEGTSMSELTEALGINRPIIYAAFGNKEVLFRKALGKYYAGQVAYVAVAMMAVVQVALKHRPASS